MKPIVSMRRALEAPPLLGDVLAGDSWSAWRTLLIAIMGEALTPEDASRSRASLAAISNPTDPSKSLGDHRPSRWQVARHVCAQRLPQRSM